VIRRQPRPRPAAGPPKADPCDAVTLEGYAGITAAVGDGFALAEALANEGVDPGGWPGADAGWKLLLAADGADGPIFGAFRAKLAEAEDWLSRRVLPIDAELGAWMGFLRAYGAGRAARGHGAPRERLGAAPAALGAADEPGSVAAERGREDREARGSARRRDPRGAWQAPAVPVVQTCVGAGDRRG
jgi:hypothetical protein